MVKIVDGYAEFTFFRPNARRVLHGKMINVTTSFGKVLPENTLIRVWKFETLRYGLDWSTMEINDTKITPIYPSNKDYNWYLNNIKNNNGGK